MTAAAVEKAAEQYREALWPALTGPGSAANRMEAALGAPCQAADQHLTLLVSLYPHPHSPFHEEVDGAALVQEPFAERSSDSSVTASPTARCVHAGADATLLFNLVSWTYVHLRHAHHWPPEEASTRVVSLVLGGVLRGEN